MFQEFDAIRKKLADFRKAFDLSSAIMPMYNKSLAQLKDRRWFDWIASRTVGLVDRFGAINRYLPTTPRGRRDGPQAAAVLVASR